MSLKYLSTGQAAAILSVTPDAVLKWIRLGILPAHRTPGGHHRIDRADLDLVTTRTRRHQPAKADPQRRPFRYCWEFYGNGDLPDKCAGCAVYEMRAHRCYEVAKLAPQSGHLKAHCTETCEECEYYRLVRKQNVSFMVVTDDEALAERLKKEAETRDFNLETADCEYFCSMKITNFRPDFVVVDCSLGRQTSSDISRHLIQDPRIPSVRVVLAGKEDEFPEVCDKEFFARMDRPFGIEELDEVARRFK